VLGGFEPDLFACQACDLELPASHGGNGHVGTGQTVRELVG
jgi:hypothetical protein